MISLKWLKGINDKFSQCWEITDTGALEHFKQYILHFSQPQSLIVRSFYQYQCQRKRKMNFFRDILYNISSFILFKPYLRSCQKKYRKQSKEPYICSQSKAFFSSSLGLSILPEKIKSNYYIIYDVDFNFETLASQDILFLKEIAKRYKYSYYFLLKNAYKVARYRAIIDTFAPQAIVATSEESFTSSILTEFCRRNNVKHLNVMHGEKYFDMTATFFQFDECYVWDEHYANIFKKMRAEENQFIVSAPQSLQLQLTSYHVCVDYKYFLQSDTKKTLTTIKDIVNQLQSKGHNVLLRPHPIYSDIQLIKKYFPSEIIESTSDVPIEQSIGEAHTLISRNSTVLLQGYTSGKPIIVDDISKPQEFNMLKSLGYIMTRKPVNLLSKVLSELNGEELK